MSLFQHKNDFDQVLYFIGSVVSFLFFINASVAISLAIFDDYTIALAAVFWLFLGLVVVSVFYPSAFIEVFKTKNPIIKGFYVILIGFFWIFYVRFK